MRLLLIRHGESVDNVAGLYAGSRDSALTNHGVLQIKRLGTHLAKRQGSIGPIKHIFTSDLQRAYQTANAIAKAFAEVQNPSSTSVSEAQKLVVSQLPELREKDYGSSEGKKYGVKTESFTRNLTQSDSESHESMKARVTRFLDSHLLPIIDAHVSDDMAVAIVAHGIILGVFLKALLERFPPRPAASTSQNGGRERLPEFTAWSNTGVLQAKLELDEGEQTLHSRSKTASRVSPVSPGDDIRSLDTRKKALRLTIELTNNLEHLEGLRKTKGGIGSAKFDSRQRTMDSFFSSASKKRKLEEVKDS
ncbi:phosphoglycerate mutase-like protein [Hypomontagnella submonticulosa]|nr:phosphoglycerate mutase-like protein [Hypomontagnella submonticulosa]